MGGDLETKVCETCERRIVIHHDHILDYVHLLLLNRLSPYVAPDISPERTKSGGRFSLFVQRHGTEVLEELHSGFDGARPIARYLPTRVCELLNAADGNGKRPTAYRDGTIDPKYWSMTPAELEAVTKEPIKVRAARWKAVWEKEKADFEERGTAAEAFAERWADAFEHEMAKGARLPRQDGAIDESHAPFGLAKGSPFICGR